MTLNLRRALPADVPAMAEIDASVSLSPWSAAQFLDAVAADARGEFAWVAEVDGAVRGFVVCQRVLDELSIHNVAVAPVAQRRGLASRLLHHALGEVRPLPARCLLEVRASNAAALALYRGLGFTEDGRRRHYYPAAEGREDAVLMSLQPGVERERA
ncbi:ribosomal protein S18-alanine N-acetyltransferase [Parahaliea aestuarii]|uniref:ribosomal protein S18-alanine N-acetyltransferase n=1 Tax=Parahaliea aestuarii TaxID=1852021 RepID=UPI00164FDACA|nr:ribosomal protein S18-alanine N-acetyltransferase [Parahaliea aestuarii]